MKNKPNIIPTKLLPAGSRRITNAQNQRVWLINGMEFVSKSEYFQFLKDQALASNSQVVEEKKPEAKNEPAPLP